MSRCLRRCGGPAGRVLAGRSVGYRPRSPALSGCQVAVVELSAMTSARVWLMGAAGAAAGLIGWAEWKTWSVSRDLLSISVPRDGARVSVLVLGCPLPVLQRWLVRIAVRSTDPERARFVFSGGAVRTPVSEAQMMADYAVQALGVPPGNVTIEDQSRTTAENIVNSAELLADDSVIMIASNTFHARRARQLIRDESPELASRLIRARDYIPLEWGLLHLLLVAFESYRDRRARAASAI
jgi:DUF218 domain